MIKKLEIEIGKSFEANYCRTIMITYISKYKDKQNFKRICFFEKGNEHCNLYSSNKEFIFKEELTKETEPIEKFYLCNKCNKYIKPENSKLNKKLLFNCFEKCDKNE